MEKRDYPDETADVITALSPSYNPHPPRKKKCGSIGVFSISALRPSGAFYSKTGEELFGKIVRSSSTKLQKDVLDSARFREHGGFLAQLHTTFLLKDCSTLFLFRKYHYGSLYEILQRNGPCPLHPEQLTKIAYSMAIALDFLHSQELTHGFITTKHCVMDELGFIRLCGLNNLHLGRRAERSRWMNYTSIGYLAPEIMNENQNEDVDPFLVDMFAFGVILHRCLSGAYPANGRARSLSDGIIFAPSDCFRNDSVPSPVPELPINSVTKVNPTKATSKFIVIEAHKTIQRLLNRNPAVRPRAGAFLHLMWLQTACQCEDSRSSFNALFFN